MHYPKIILLRHGQTIWNREGRYQGKKDSPLTLKGEQQARDNAQKLKRYFKKENISTIEIFSSPLGRAKSTAFILCDDLEIAREKIQFEERIEEFSYGIFEGERKSFCQTYYKKEFQSREADKWFYEIEGGESYVLVTKRLKHWLASLDNTSTILVIAHEMVNRALRGLYLGLEKEEILSLRQDNSVVLLLESGKEKIVT